MEKLGETRRGKGGQTNEGRRTRRVRARVPMDLAALTPTRPPARAPRTPSRTRPHVHACVHTIISHRFPQRRSNTTLPSLFH